MAIEGKYEMESSEHFEEFVKEMGKFSYYLIDGSWLQIMFNVFS